ncbi:MAG: LytTR family DNA-binding domain-containing protein [Clostridiales bacterium]
MLNIAICDDNEFFCDEMAKILKKILQDCTPQPFNVTCLYSAEELINVLKTESFHIILLDIDLGNNIKNGINLGQEINISLPLCQIIFITAHLSYVSQVYEVKHTYFALKSDIRTYLPLALTKAISNLEEQKNHTLCVKDKDKNTTFFIPQNTIIYIEHDKRVTKIVTEDNIYRNYDKLDNIEKSLYSPPFVRCHKSFIINLNHINSFQKTVFICMGNVKVPISRSHYNLVVAIFKKFIGNTV